MKTDMGKKMRKGPGWKIESKSGLPFNGTLREVLHGGGLDTGKMIAIFYMRRRKTGK